MPLNKETYLPFTPFHMGAVLVAKPWLNRNVSVITFGLAQIAMDIEPGIGMLTGAGVLHGPTHTILGALVIAFIVMLMAPRICSYALRRWNSEVTFYKLLWLVQVDTTSRTAVAVGALFGTLSHIALDSLMHHDIHPLSPFSQANPLMGLVTHDGVYQLCAIAGAIGMVVWVAIQWKSRRTQIDLVRLQPELKSESPHQGFWKLWILDLRVTWFWLFLLSVVPSLLFSTALFSMSVLAFAVFIVTPATVISRFFTKEFGSRGLRQFAVMFFVPVLSLVYILKSDDQISANATPIVQAIESYRLETGNYPDSLEVLEPRYLSKIPELNYLVIQPHVTYRMTDGKPYLGISSAAGGFAHFEYDFETKVWTHYS